MYRYSISGVRGILSIKSKGLHKKSTVFHKRNRSIASYVELAIATSSCIVVYCGKQDTYPYNLLCDAMMDRFQRFVTDKEQVITGSDPLGLPYSIQRGKHQRRMDLKVTHEEADVIVVKHVVHIAKQTPETIHVISDDTDVFVLLVHFFASEGPRCKIFLVSRCPTKNTINIGNDKLATVNKHAEIAKYSEPSIYRHRWDNFNYCRYRNCRCVEIRSRISTFLGTRPLASLYENVDKLSVDISRVHCTYFLSTP